MFQELLDHLRELSIRFQARLSRVAGIRAELQERVTRADAEVATLSEAIQGINDAIRILTLAEDILKRPDPAL